MNLSRSLSDHLSVWGLEKNFTVFEDGSLGFGLRLKPHDVTCKSDEEVNLYASQLSGFLNGLPENTDVQFIQDITTGNEPVLNLHTNLLRDETNEIAKELTDERVRRYRGDDQNGSLPFHTLYLFVRKPMSGCLNDKPSVFSKNRNFSEIAEARFSSEIASIERTKEVLIQHLNALQLSPEQIGAEELARLMYRQWNPERKVDLLSYDPNDIRDSLLFTDLSISEKGFSLGATHHRVISLKLLPDQTFASVASVLRELPFDSRLFLTCRVPNQAKELESLQTQRRLAFSLSRGKKEGVSDLESEAKFQDVEALLEEMIAQDERIYYVSLNVLLKSDDLNTLEDQVNQTLMTIRSLGGAEAMEETIAAFDVFSEMAIPNAIASERAKRMKTSNLRDLLPVYGPWPGHDQPSILLKSRFGSLVGFNPFHREFTNYNQIVSGGSGSGKSFLTNILLLQMLKENPKVFIVDIGGSYKKLCESLGGQYVHLGVDSGHAINPFDLLPGETEPSNHKIKFLVSLIELMTKEDDTERLPRLHRAEIEECIAQVYSRVKSPQMSDLKNRLLEHEDIEIRRYGRILSPWCGDTPYGRFLDRPTSISLEKSVVSFDLKGMESYPDLQAVSLFLITDFVWREVQLDRGSKKFLVFDECWKLLEDDAGATFIAEVFRTFRKYHASAIAISQNIDDFAKSRVSGAILSNSSVKWVLMQKGSDFKRLQEVLQLNKNEVELVGSIHQERGKYSEAFLIAQDDRTVVAIESTPLEYWLATTDPRDLELISSIEKENPNFSHWDTLKKAASKYPNGVSAHR